MRTLRLSAESVHRWLAGVVDDLFSASPMMTLLSTARQKSKHRRRIYQLACRRRYGNRFGISLTSDPWRTYKRVEG